VLHSNHLNTLLVVKMDLPIPNRRNANLVVKIKAVSDGTKEDLNEAITQAMNTDLFSDSWAPILQKLKFLQGVGNTLSEVRLIATPFILNIA